MSAELRRIFAKNLAERRRRVGLVQAELAEKAGVSTEFVSRLERAVTMPSLPTVVSLCRALQCTPNDLVLGALPRTASVEGLASRLAAAPAERTREVLRVAEALLEYGAPRTAPTKAKKRHSR